MWQYAKGALAPLGALLYAVCVFVACAYADSGWWGLLPLVLPLTWWLTQKATRALQWRSAYAVTAALTTTTAVAALYIWGMRHLTLNHDVVRALYFLQESVVLLGFSLGFGWTLRAGKTPLCTLLAALWLGEVTPNVARYTRWVTVAWSVWMFCLWLGSLVLFFIASAPVWAFYSTALIPVLMGALFAVDFALRPVFLLPHERPGIVSSFRSMAKVDWPRFFRQCLGVRSE